MTLYTVSVRPSIVRADMAFHGWGVSTLTDVQWRCHILSKSHTSTYRQVTVHVCAGRRAAMRAHEIPFWRNTTMGRSTYRLHLQPEPSLQQCWGWCIFYLEPSCGYLFHGKWPNTKFRIAPRACVRCPRNRVIIVALAAQSDSPSIRNYRKAKRFLIECSVYSSSGVFIAYISILYILAL